MMPADQTRLEGLRVLLQQAEPPPPPARTPISASRTAIRRSSTSPDGATTTRAWSSGCSSRRCTDSRASAGISS